MAAADYRLMTEATGQRIAAALESLVNLGDPVTIAHGGTGASTAAAALTALGGVAVTDIVDDLISTATNKPLSAAQGKALNDAMPKTMSISATTDGTGRFVVAKPIDKLVVVHLYDNTCYTILRYLDTTQTLVYVRNINTNDPVTNTSLTGSAVYFD